LEQGLEEVGADDLAQSVGFALKRDRKAIQKLESCDDEGHFRAARRIAEYLRMCGYRFFRKPIDWRSRYPASNPEPARDDEQRDEAT
jgi:hypothetical protein